MTFYNLWIYQVIASILSDSESSGHFEQE